MTKVIDNSIEATKEVVKDIPKNVSDVVNNTKSALGLDFYSNKTVVVFGLIFVVFLSLFVGYGLYYYISGTLFNQTKIVIEGTKIPILANTLTKYPITYFNRTGNGLRRTYTFWIYINDMNKYSGQYKHVFHIGGSTDDLTTASPYVFLDKTENKMFFRFASINPKNDSVIDNNVNSLQSMASTSLFNKYMTQGIEIPYIPIQRWVHVAVVINENSNGGTIVAYVDGDVSKISSTGEILPSGDTLNITQLALDRTGDLYVGGNFDGLEAPGFSGLISKVTLFNYDLNDRDIYNDYNEGPLNGFLSSLGLANYGLRSPIYRIV